MNIDNFKSDKTKRKETSKIKEAKCFVYLEILLNARKSHNLQ